MEDLRRLTLQQLRRHYSSFYNPGNATLVVVGDLDAAEALARIRSVFESIPPGVTPSTRVAAEPQQHRQRRVFVRMPGNVARMLIAFQSPPITSPDIYAISLIDKVLSEGKLCRLFQRLVEQEQLMSSITTEFTECIDPHLFYVRGELNPGADPSHVEAVVFEELEKLQREPVPQEEWKRAQNQLSNQYLSGFETTMDQAVQYGMFETIASHRLLESYLGRVQSVTPADIRRVARAYLQRRKSTVGFVAP
jgi:zinc protease